MGLFDSLGEYVKAKTAPIQPQPQQTQARELLMVKEKPKGSGLFTVFAIVAVLGLLMTFMKQSSPPAHHPQQMAAFSPANAGAIASGYPRSVAQNPDTALAAQERLYSNGSATPGQSPYGQQQVVDAQALERDRLQQLAIELKVSPVVRVAAEPPSASGIAVLPTTSPVPTEGAAVMAPKTPAAASPSKPSESHRADCLDMRQGDEMEYAVCAGTPIPLVLNNRLTGEFTGPVVATVSQDIKSRDREHLLIPKGTRVLGRAEKVGDQNQARLAVNFNRILFANGRGYTLTAPGLDQAGDSALKADKINRHILATFSTSIAMAALAGFSTIGTGSYLNGNGVDMYRQGVAQNLGMQAQQQASLNMSRRMPTIEVDEGHLIELFLEEDLLMPEYSDLPTIQTSFGPAEVKK